jgi:tripartite-type tricarboxylate transporter receptor subunit TctC
MRMLRHRRTGFAQCIVLAATLLCATAGAQPYPHKPIRLVTAEVGGSADFSARTLAQALSASLGQQVVVDNRPSGVIPPDLVAKAQPDGYTLLLYSNGMWTLPLMQAAPYDPQAAFAPVSLTSRSPNFVVVHTTVAAQSIRELIALAKAKPGHLNYGSGAPGAATHLAGELFKAMAAVDIVRIPYKGGGPALAALLGGQVQVMFPTAASVSPHVKAGRLRALAVTSAQPSALFPDIPTVTASGLPGYVAEQNIGVFAPAKTPAAVIERLQREVNAAVRRPEVRERFANAGVEPVGTTPGEFSAVITADIARMKQLIQSTGIRAE